MSSTGRRIIRMPLSALLSVLAQPELGADAPSWAPIVFAVGALVVVVLVLILVRQKLKQYEMRRQDPDHPEDADARDPDQD